MNRSLMLSLAAAVALVAAPACGGKKAEAPKKAQPEAVKAEPTKAEPTKAEPAADPAKAEPAKVEVAKADPAKADPTKADPHKSVDPHGKTTDAPPMKRIEGPVAKVNGTSIDSDTFYEELDKITQRNNRIPPERLARIQQNILKRLVEKELINQAVAKAAVKVEDPEIAAAYAEYKKRFQTDEQFKNYLKHGRVTEDSIKDRLKEKKALEKLIDKRGNLTIGDAEAKEFYDKNERFYLEKAGTKASHILIKVPEKATKEQEAAALAKVKEVEKMLKSADFAEVAKKKSEGPSKPKGGDLGFFGKGQMVKPFEEAAFKMKVGEVSGPVKTRFGFHIIKVTDRREERKKPFDEVKEQIAQSLKNKKFFQERRTLLAELRKEAKVEQFLPEPPPAAKGSPAPLRKAPPMQKPPIVKPPAGAQAAPGIRQVAPVKPAAPVKAPADKAAPAPAPK